LFDAAVVLLDPLVLVAAGPVQDAFPQRLADGARIGVVPIRRRLRQISDVAPGGAGLPLVVLRD